ncbi:MAG: hypothetical protein JXA03_02425, partial [Bacteroidales bacterium]|nr:hypothetical protein [Bacteroidales bacterium]
FHPFTLIAAQIYLNSLVCKKGKQENSAAGRNKKPAGSKPLVQKNRRITLYRDQLISFLPPKSGTVSL